MRYLNDRLRRFLLLDETRRESVPADDRISVRKKIIFDFFGEKRRGDRIVSRFGQMGVRSQETQTKTTGR